MTGKKQDTGEKSAEKRITIIYIRRIQRVCTAKK